MKQSSSWEINQLKPSQEINRIICKRKVHYRIYRSPPRVPILDQTNLFQAPFHFLKIDFNDHSNNFGWAVQIIKLVIV